MEGVDLGVAMRCGFRSASEAWFPGRYEDNSDVVALLDGRGGLLDMLDEELAIPRATDLTFANKAESLESI